ncbi:MAG: AraC family transcriptional regulator [Lachnospiraceae bacterium]|nr:AraC family transcriptional regulator [Lachnospiraceae bacterium]
MIEFYETTYDMTAKHNSDLEPVLFGFEDCRPGHFYGPTLRSYHLFHFVTGGTGRLEIGGKHFDLGAGDIFIIPADSVSYYEASMSDPWSYSWMGMTGLRAGTVVDGLRHKTPEEYVIRNVKTERYTEIIRQTAVLKGNSLNHYFRSQASLMSVLSCLMEDTGDMPGGEFGTTLARRVRSYLDAKYTEKLQLTEAADYFHIHPNHMSRIFREEYGVSPKHYLIEKKIERSELLLSESDMSVAEIAVLLGFDDQHAFSRMFRKYRGTSPSGFRIQAGG